MATNRESDRFLLRLPDGMRDQIKRTAEAHGRSMNAEIVSTLEAKYASGESDISDQEKRFRVLESEVHTLWLLHSLEMHAAKGKVEGTFVGHRDKRQRLLIEAVQRLMPTGDENLDHPHGDKAGEGNDR